MRKSALARKRMGGSLAGLAIRTKSLLVVFQTLPLPMANSGLEAEDEARLLTEQRAFIEEQVKTLQETLKKIEERVKEVARDQKMALPKKRFQCGSCREIIEVLRGVPKPAKCPKCGASAFMIHRLEPGPPGGKRDRGGPRWGHA